jgi:hypothetical protein
MESKRSFASIGFRAKTGRAIAIALSGLAAAPRYLGRWDLTLYDPLVPSTAQPHHEVMELPWIEALSAVRPIEARIEKVAVEALAALLSDCANRGCRVAGAGVVGSPDRNLERLGNPHVRAHAAEGILFRRVIEVAAAKLNVNCRSFSDRGFEDAAVSELRQTPEKLDAMLNAIGRSAGKPWRADEKAAATAAWLMLEQ